MEKRGQIRSLMVQIVSDELQITNFNFHLNLHNKIKSVFKNLLALTVEPKALLKEWAPNLT